MEDSQNHLVQGVMGTVVCGVSTFIAWLSLQNAQTLLTIFATIVAIISGGMATRYYYYAGQEKKINIQKEKVRPDK